jgi:hypothetical protein
MRIAVLAPIIVSVVLLSPGAAAETSLASQLSLAATLCWSYVNKEPVLLPEQSGKDGFVGEFPLGALVWTSADSETRVEITATPDPDGEWRNCKVQVRTRAKADSELRSAISRWASASYDREYHEQGGHPDMQSNALVEGEHFILLREPHGYRMEFDK